VRAPARAGFFAFENRAGAGHRRTNFLLIRATHDVVTAAHDLTSPLNTATRRFTESGAMMDFHPPFLIFCALGASVMIISIVLAIVAEKVDNWLDRQTQACTRRRVNVPRHAEVSHLL
jgi:hypothetical protein